MLNDLAWSDSVASAATATFDQQMTLAQSVIKDLEIDEGVHWSTIKEALQVPQSPYLSLIMLDLPATPVQQIMGMERIGMPFVLGVLALSISACAPAQPSLGERLVLIKLEAAEQMDDENLSGGKSEIVQANDSIYQASQAQKIILRLRQGKTVTQAEISDALDVLPESVTPEAKNELIKELSIAESRDDLREQTTILVMKARVEFIQRTTGASRFSLKGLEG
jgi:hypothetical protein